MIMINAILQIHSTAVPLGNTSLQSFLTGFAEGALMVFLDAAPVLKPPARVKPMVVTILT